MAAMQKVEVRDYDNEWVNRLAVLLSATDKMQPDERAAALRYLKHKYPKEWPSDDY